jgi:hypothetical protein
MGLRVGYAHCPHCTKLQRWFYESETTPTICFGCGKVTCWAECEPPELGDEWVPLVLGSEISVVQKKELHGRISHGWFSEGKVLIADAKDYNGVKSPVFEQLVKLAHEEAARRNDQAKP